MEFDLLSEKWEEILQQVKDEHRLSEVSFDTWLRPLQLYAVSDGVLYLLIPNIQQQMGLSFIENKYSLPLKVAVSEVTGLDLDIKFILPGQKNAIKPQNPRLLAPASADSEKPNSNLNPNYTFDTFVVGSNNRFAQSAALAVAESPGDTYNPLYIYGGPGLGKTHLLHSIGHFLLDSHPDMKVIYVTSEEFTNEVIEAIRSGSASSMSRLRDKYRTVDVLMVDDIQFIIGKESTQEEFFHTFNALQTQGKQIVLTSDKPPKEMETLEDRIRSRFEWGLMADIGVPDYETRMAILRKKSESDHFSVDDEILDYIAVNIKSNVRELEGALNKLVAFQKLEGCPITMGIAKQELHGIITPDEPKEVTPQLILEVVSEHFHISLDQMISKDRRADVSRSRQIAMYLCKEMTQNSLETIGKLLGNRDHSTVIYGIRCIEEEYATSEAMRNTIEAIKKKINPN